MNYISVVAQSLAALAFGLLLQIAAQAADFKDWRSGDLIFQNSGRGQSNAILAATGSPFTHVGIVKVTSDGPVVVEAVGPVQETPLTVFIGRGENGAYAVYRVRGLSRKQALKALTEAGKYYGRPYDPFFRLDEKRIYCSELVWFAFSAAGYKLGKLQPFNSLNIDNPYVRELFASRWRRHPDCGMAKDLQSCWTMLAKQRIVTPASLVADDMVTVKIFSNF